MKRVEFIHFEQGDPEPSVPYVIDSNEVRWESPRIPGKVWTAPSIALSRFWENLLVDFGEVRIPAEALVGRRTTLVSRLEAAEKALADFDALFASDALPATQKMVAGMYPNGYVFEVGGPESEPQEIGLVLRDKEGDFWRKRAGGWEFCLRTDGDFLPCDANWAFMLGSYGRLIVVPDPTR